MGGPNDKSIDGPGPEDKSTMEQTLNTRAAIIDAQRSKKIDPQTITNTVGDAMLLKNLINLNPVGVMKNIGSKLILDKITNVPDTEEDDSPMQVADVTYDQQKNILENVLNTEDTNLDQSIENKEKREDIQQKLLQEIQNAKDGGRIGAMGGGVMGGLADGNFDFENARQMYGLGKLVKKVTRSVKKIAKSPIGKAALLYTGLGGLGSIAGGGTFFGNFASPIAQMQGVGSIFSKKGLGNIASRIGLGSMQTFVDSGSPAFEKFVPNMLGRVLTSPSTLIAGTSLLAGALSPEEEQEAQQISDETGIDIATIRANPNQYLARRFRAEGGSMKEPVAKKTMPLLDMDGQEMDLRAEGGFVPIGRMEKADDVPARLSKNEFVFTADAVRNAGDGDVDKGAEVMYNMMKNLESGGEVSEESQGLEGARKMFQTSQRLEEVL